ncbi:hypothetical protein DFH28DRAFT_1131365 [Melampsora americana]|nr:hypothetical protein DFH28DRAFT_1131365 [Melampsora americana]
MTSFNSLRVFNGVLYDDYRAAAAAWGLLMSDAHYDSCLTEAALWKTGAQLQSMFALILVHSPPPNSQRLWDDHIEDLIDNVQYRLALMILGITPTAAHLPNYGLALLEHNITDMGETVLGVDLMPVDPMLLTDVRGYNCRMDTDKISPEEHLNSAIPQLTLEQADMFNAVQNTLQEGSGKSIFVNGPGGCQKKFLLNTCLHYCNA